MVRGLLFSCVAWALATAIASAGPWPREAGATFLSFSTLVTSPSDSIGDDVQTFTSIYYERGMQRQLTFGLDAGFNDEWDYSVLAFVKAPIMQSADPHKFAVRFGLGTIDGPTQDYTAMAGAYWGRGFESGFGPGWASLDLQARYRFDAGDTVLKADATLGVKPSDRLKLILQVQTGDYPGSEPFIRLAPSVVWSIGEGRHIEFGGQIGVLNDDRVGLKLGTWFEF